MISSGCTNEKKKTTQKDNFFAKNGGAVLEKTIRLFNGKTNPLRSYSSQQLNKATNGFHPSRIIRSFWFYNLYKGIDQEEHSQISVKTFSLRTNYDTDEKLDMIATEVAIASQMSNHKNVLKLLGYCLDTELPMLVYELPAHGNLSNFLSENERLPFETRLRIGTGIANALAYLHHGHAKTFVYRDIRKEVVFLDEDYGAKLFNFQACIPIPEGQTHVEADTYGVLWYISPEANRGRYTIKSDVYGLGILLSELLTGKNLGQLLWETYDSGDRSGNNLDAWKSELEATVLEDQRRDQIMECAKLVERCLKFNADERPDMVEVAKALRLVKSTIANDNTNNINIDL